MTGGGGFQETPGGWTTAAWRTSAKRQFFLGMGHEATRPESKRALAVVSVNGKPPRLEPPASLPKAERIVFVGLVTACDPEHFRASDLPLLCRYAEAIVLAEHAAQNLRRGAVVDGKP